MKYSLLRDSNIFTLAGLGHVLLEMSSPDLKNQAFRWDNKMEEIVKGKWCINTQRHTVWAVRVFKGRVKECNSKCPDQTVSEWLEQQFVDQVVPLNRWIALFVVEARNRKGKPYPPTPCKALPQGFCVTWENMSNCSVNISPQNFAVNINKAPVSVQGKLIFEQEFDEHLECVDLEY